MLGAMKRPESPLLALGVSLALVVENHDLDAASHAIYVMVTRISELKITHAS